MMPTADAALADASSPSPRSGSTRSAMHVEIVYLIDEEFRPYREKSVRRWIFFSAVPIFRWRTVEGEELKFEGIAFSGSVRHIFWDLAGVPFMKAISRRCLEAIARLADERRFDRNEAVLDAAMVLKSRVRGTFKVMHEVDGRLVHGPFGSKDAWRPPPIERLELTMDDFIDGIAAGWLQSGGTATVSSLQSTVAIPETTPASAQASVSAGAEAPAPVSTAGQALRPWMAHRSGGLPLMGWKAICAALHVACTEAKRKRIKRLNDRTDGPIVLVGRIAQVDKGELLAWVGDSNSQALAAAEERSLRAAAAEECGERGGVRAADLSMHTTRRPSGGRTRLARRRKPGP